MKRKQMIVIGMTILTLALAVMLCASVIALYADGAARRRESGSSMEPIFTRALVTQQLRRIAPLAALWVAGVIGAIVTGSLAPKHGKPLKDTETMLRLLLASSSDVPKSVEREKLYRRNVQIACGVSATICFGVALKWLLNRANYTGWDLESVMGETLRRTLPFIAMEFAILLIGVHLCEKSRLRAIDALKAVPRERRAKSAQAPMKGTTDTIARIALRAVLYVAAVVLIIAGVFNGGLNDVLVKAINICTECIGLG